MQENTKRGSRKPWFYGSLTHKCICMESTLNIAAIYPSQCTKASWIKNVSEAEGEQHSIDKTITQMMVLRKHTE